ncbi:hypothetical protein CTAYLR_002518 [Chrysophaeum taylorii]|uniref:Fumarylacetoacetase-like C-terminal domain-containing protein n=1 Tax=Chrysophaeum taylorii TaxID=2483200 RepID=A0AAD7UF61_9STRA|nr:hypothetical protein CTAYLR_002518 [Chrysophaeum taylorii]
MWWILVFAFAGSAAFEEERTTADAIIRFVDTTGVERLGAYVGGGRARVVTSEEPTPDKSWVVGDVVVEVGQLLTPVSPPYVLAIGLNYIDHIIATNSTAPLTPAVFFKGSHSVHHPLSPIVIPEISTKPDYEGELGLVFSRDCKDISEADALDCVLGYVVCHDVSARCYQNEDDADNCPGNGGQYSFSKSFDTHAPIGPRLVSVKTLGNATGLTLQTRVNGDLRQNSTTSSLIFGVQQIVSFMTSGTTIPKHTVVCTGTPDGVGDTMDPPTYLQDGDVVDVYIEHIGVLRNPITRLSTKHGLLGRTHVDFDLDDLLLFPSATA